MSTIVFYECTIDLVGIFGGKKNAGFNFSIENKSKTCQFQYKTERLLGVSYV